MISPMYFKKSINLLRTSCYQAGSIESLISNTLLSAKTAVAAAQQQVVVTVGKIQKCAQKSTEKATDKINQLVTNVQQCISEEKEN